MLIRKFLMELLQACVYTPIDFLIYINHSFGIGSDAIIVLRNFFKGCKHDENINNIGNLSEIILRDTSEPSIRSSVV